MGRDDAVVVGEGAVDQLGGQRHLAEAEAGLDLADFHRDVLGEVFEQFQDFADRLARRDHARHADGARRRRGLDAGEAVAVGGDGAQHGRAIGLGGVEIDAVEIVARLFGRNRELGVVDEALEFDGGKLELVGEFAGGEIGEIGRRQALQEEAGAAGAQEKLAGAGVDFEADLRAVRKLSYDIVEDVGGDGGRAGDRDIGGGDFGRLQIEVGGFQFELAVFRLDQHVGQDRDRVAALHDAVDVAQRLQESGALDGDFHDRGPDAAAATGRSG